MTLVSVAGTVRMMMVMGVLQLVTKSLENGPESLDLVLALEGTLEEGDFTTDFKSGRSRDPDQSSQVSSPCGQMSGQKYESHQFCF